MLSKEEITIKRVKNIKTFHPVTPEDIKKWVKNQVKVSIKKGANYLICNVPGWYSHNFPALGKRWVKSVFGNTENIEPDYIKINLGIEVPNYFKGVYIVSNHMILKICLH